MSAAISNAVMVFESKLPSLRLSEREGPRALETGQRGHPRVANGQSAESVASLAADREASDAAINDRGAETAAIRELRDDCLGNSFDRPVDQDLVVRRRGGMAGFERTPGDLDPSIARGGGKLRIAFQRHDVEPHGIEHRGRIAGTGT